MMENKDPGSGFYKHLIYSSLIVFIIALYPVSAYTSIIQLYSLISGYIIGLLNALIGFKLNLIALKKPVKSFMVLVFGGMGLRMIFIAIIILILIYFAKLDEIYLVASVFFFYTLFVSIELFHLHRNKQQNLN